MKHMKVREFFLEALGMPSGATSAETWRRLRNGYLWKDLPAERLEFLAGRGGRGGVLAWEEANQVELLTAIYLTSTSPAKLGVSSLLLPEYSKAALRLQLEACVEKYFSQDADALLLELGEAWHATALSGLETKPIYWKEKIEAVELQSLFKEEVPVFPSVYLYNNPYSRELLTVGLEKIQKGMHVLALGCGAGIDAGLAALRSQTLVHATDINPFAVANAKATAFLMGVEGKVKAWVSDAFQSIPESYDLILLSAPLATQEERPDDPNRFDPEGRFLKSVLNDLDKHLRENGRMIFMGRPDLEASLPPHLQNHILKRFTAGASLAIHEILRR